MYISEISKISGLSVHTLRYYEKEGLLENVTRNDSGRRVYSNDDLVWIEWIQRLKSTGMSLDEIRQFSSLRYLGDDSISQRKDMLIDHSMKLKSNIQKLREELSVVDHKIKAYEEKEKSLT